MNRKHMLLILVLSLIFPALGAGNEGYSASTEVVYKGVSLRIYAITTKEGIEAEISIDKDYEDKMDEKIFPAFMFSGPHAKITVPTVSSKCEELSDGCRSVKAIIEFWCNDLRTGWDVLGLFRGKGFQRIGMTRSDSLTGFWKVIAIDTETGDVIGEIEVWVKKAKPGTGEKTERN